MTATVSAPASVARARQLLHSAAEASKQLEENVRELVAMRAWDVLGYENFSDMWEKENGFECPPYVQVLFVDTYRREGMNTRRGKSFASAGPNGHTRPEVARALGVPVQLGTGGRETSNMVYNAITQLDHGVPPEKVVRVPSGAALDRHIAKHGSRARPKPRRLGASPDDLVHEGMYIAKRDVDEINEIARKADLPKSEIYRQAVAEYLAHYRASRPEAAS